MHVISVSGRAVLVYNIQSLRHRRIVCNVTLQGGSPNLAPSARAQLPIGIGCLGAEQEIVQSRLCAQTRRCHAADDALCKASLNGALYCQGCSSGRSANQLTGSLKSGMNLHP